LVHSLTIVHNLLRIHLCFFTNPSGFGFEFMVSEVEFYRPLVVVAIIQLVSLFLIVFKKSLGIPISLD
jgi:hypothetical protein